MAALWRVLPLPLLLSHRKWGTERLINSPKVTQLANGRGRNRTEATRLWSSCSNLLLSSCDRFAKYQLLTVHHVRCPRIPFETNLATSLWGGLYILLIKKQRLFWSLTQSCVTTSIGPGIQTRVHMPPELVFFSQFILWPMQPLFCPVFKVTSCNILQLS